MNKKTISEAIAEIERELEMRKFVYPGLIQKGKLTRDAANHQYQCLEKSLQILKAMIPNQTEIF